MHRILRDSQDPFDIPEKIPGIIQVIMLIINILTFTLVLNLKL